MLYDPHYEYSGPDGSPIKTTADAFHFWIRLALRGHRLAHSGARTTRQFEDNADAHLRRHGWSIMADQYPGGGQNLFACVCDEGNGLVVSRIADSRSRHWLTLKDAVPATLAELGI